MAVVLVVDASAVVDLLAGTARAAEVHNQLRAAEALAAPELLTVEVASALHRLTRAGVLSAAEAGQAVVALTAMPLWPIPHAVLLEDAWRLRQAVRVADAFYLATARRLGVPLLTTDARLSRAGVSGVTVTLVQ